MKVLHVIPSVSRVHGGPTHALAMMERSLSAIGVQVTTLTTDDDGPGRRLSESSRPRNANGATRHYARKWTEFYKVAPTLFIWILRHGGAFDVVHIHALFSFSSLAAAIAARIRRVPYIVRPLGTLNRYGVQRRRPWIKAASFWLAESRILSGASAVHFTSEGEWAEAKALGVPMRGIVIPLGIDRAEQREPNTPPFKVEVGQKVVLFLSRLDPKKNIEGLIKAFRLVRQAHPSAVLVIAGDGPAEYVQSLQTLAKTEGVEDATIWIGHVEGERKWDAFAAADVFVLPSLSENFGIAAVEAMAAGLACIVGHGVAIAEAVAGARAGLATEPDPKSIAGALDELLAQDKLRQEMGARGRELAEREYSPMLMASRLHDLYADIIGSSGPRRRP